MPELAGQLSVMAIEAALAAAVLLALFRARRVLGLCAMRATDIVCRFGGEEFCLILPGTSIESAALFAGRIRQELPAACARAGVTDTILRAADRRLYRGKDGRRDCVVAA